MMNELADRLEAWKRDIDHWRSQDMCGIRPRRKERLLTLECSCNPVVEPNFEAIIKALRFAADMEKLMHEHAQPWFEDCVGGKTELRVTVRYEVRYFYGPDIYTAARKAVEALEKGDGELV